MQATLEQAIETVQSLTAQDREKLRRWMLEEQRPAENGQNGVDVIEQIAPKKPKPKTEYVPDWKEKAERSKQSMDWIEANRAEYLGQWVALDGGVLVAQGINAKAVADEARAKGVKSPFLEQVCEKETGAYWGGWD